MWYSCYFVLVCHFKFVVDTRHGMKKLQEAGHFLLKVASFCNTLSHLGCVPCLVNLNQIPVEQKRSMNYCALICDCTLLLNSVPDSKITKSETETDRFSRLNQEANFCDFPMCKRFLILTFIHLQCCSMLIAVLHLFPTCVSLSEPQSGTGCLKYV